MANWSNPTLTSNYVDFVDQVKGRDDDAARQFDPANTTATNVPVNAIRYNGGATRWERWNGTNWNPLASTYAINVATASAWQTARTVTIGNTGKSVNGGANVSWTLAEIGALAASNPSYTGTLTGGTGIINIGSGQFYKAANGNVGIGTSSPAVRVSGTVLSINGPNQGSIELLNNNASAGEFFSNSTGTNICEFRNLPLNFRTNNTEYLRLDIAGSLVATSSATGHWQIPRGSTAQRPSGQSGMLRFNTSLGKFEGHNGTAWSSVGGGATGGGANEVFFENDQTVTVNYTITTNKNAMSAGPVEIANGVEVTVPNGSTWTVV